MRSRGVAFIAFSVGVLLITAGLAQAQQRSDPTPAPRWLEIEYDLRVTEDLSRIELTGTVDMHEVEETDELARFCDGDSCTADELREVYQRFGPSRQKQLVSAIEDRVATQTEAVLITISGAEQARSNATLDESALEGPAEGDPYRPAIPVAVEGSAPLQMLGASDLTDAQLDALLQMGARSKMPVQASIDAGTNITMTLELPPAVAAVETQSATTRQDGRLLAWETLNWKASSALTLNDLVLVGDPDVVVPERERVDLDVVLDLSSVDVHYLDAVTGGQPATVTANMTVNGTIRSIENPRSTEGVELDHLSADAIRIGLEHDLISLGQFTAYEDDARSRIRGFFRSSLGAEVTVSGGFVPASLETDGVGSPPGTGGPVYLDMGAAEEVPFPPEEDGLGQASAFEITRVPMGVIELPTLSTPGDQPANITLILPDGVELDYQSADAGNVTRSTTEDGRTIITFRTQEGGEPVTIQGAELVVNHPIVWSLLWPLLVFLLLVLVVLPAAIIYYVIRQRRKRRGVNQERRSPVRGGYADDKERADASDGEDGGIPGSGPSDAGGSGDDRPPG